LATQAIWKEFLSDVAVAFRQSIPFSHFPSELLNEEPDGASRRSRQSRLSDPGVRCWPPQRTESPWWMRRRTFSFTNSAWNRVRILVCSLWFVIHVPPPFVGVRCNQPTGVQQSPSQAGGSSGPSLSAR